jgi:hypothetical protein
MCDSDAGIDVFLQRPVLTVSRLPSHMAGLGVGFFAASHAGARPFSARERLMR